MKNQSNEKMPFVLMEKETMLISFDEREIQVPSETEGETITMYEYESVRVKKYATYGDIVAAIVRDHYSQNQVEAIVLNGNDTPEHEAEYLALKEWRVKAKAVAREVISPTTI